MSYSYSDEVLADSPYLYWKLDDTTGTTATDSSGNGRNGTYTNSPTLNQTTLVPTEGASVDLDGTNDYVAYTLPADVTGDFSLEVWFNNDTYSNYPGLFGAWTANSNGNYGTNLQLSDTGSFDINVARNNFNFWEINAGGFGSISTGTTYHVVLTVDDTNNEVKLFINGSQSGSTQTITNQVGLGANGKSLVLGSVGDITTGGWNGRVDNFAVYTSVLSPSRITAHYNAATGPTIDDLVAPDVDVAGKDATINVEFNLDINAVVTDIDVTGIAATVSVTSDATINAVVSDIDVNGKDATVVIITDVTVNAVVTDVDVAGQAASIVTDSSVQIAINSTDIDVDAKDVTLIVTSDVNQTAVVSNIDINTFDIENLYPSFVVQDNPTHYWKFTLQPTEYVIKDFAGTKDGAIVSVAGNVVTNLDASNFTTGISGDYNSNAVILNGSISTSTRERIQFSGAQPTIIGDNLTYELWFKTSSPEVELLVFDSPDYESFSYFNVRKTALGLINGKLSTWQMAVSSTEWNNKTNIATYDLEVNDGNWHHLMLTKTTVSGTATYRSYLDGVETPTTLSLGTLLQFAILTTARDYITGTYTVNETDTLFFIGNAFGSNYGGTAGVNYVVQIDDVAIYKSALTQQDAIDRFGTGTGSIDVQITVTSTDIDIQSGSTLKPVTVNVSKANINIKSNMPGVSDGSNVNIGSTAPKINVNGKAPTISLTAVSAINVVHGEVSIAGKLNKVNTNINFFKFISSTDTALSAQDAVGISSLDFAGLLFNQEKKLLFRIGNTNTVKSTFNISVNSRSTDILDAIKLSTDNINYYNNLTIENVNPNDITEIIYIKFTSNFVYLLGPGSFLINVEQINV